MMRIRTSFRMLLCLAMAGVFSSAHALTEQELVAKLKAAGYSQIGEIKSTAEGTVVNAVKDGKNVHLLVDGTGQIKER
jgi:hypothetical protein